MYYPGQRLIMGGAVGMMILGALGTFSGINALSGGANALTVYETLISVVMVASAVAGFIWWKQSDKAMVFIGAGIAVIVLKLIDLVIGLVVVSGASADNLNDQAFLAGLKFGLILGVMIGIIPSILYIVGGNKFKNL